MSADLKTIYDDCLKYMSDEIVLIDDIFQNAMEHYQGKLYMHREFCIGSLLIARFNIQAAISIATSDLVYQLHYISRNNFEVMIDMYYVLDPLDTHERDVRLERYKAFSRSIVPNKVVKAIENYPEHFQENRPDEEDILKKKQQYQIFMEKYKQEKGNARKSWSGKNLMELINELKDEGMRYNFSVLYDFIVQHNNVYVHPSWHYMTDTINLYMDKKPDFNERIGQLSSIFHSSKLIAQKFVEHFPKGRQAFIAKLEKLAYDFIRFKESA